MPPDGIEILANWREAGAWWEGEPYREVTRFLDGKGIRREKEELFPSLGTLAVSGQTEYREDNTIEVSERARKIRDEKVAAACGMLPGSYYEQVICERAINSPQKPHREVRRDDWGMPTGYSGIQAVRRQTAPFPYVPLHVNSGYAIGRGSILAEEIPLVAATFGLPACAIADPFSLVGAVEFSRACRKHGVKPLIGASIEMPEGGELVLIAKSKRGFLSLSQLLSECHLEEPRLFPLGSWERLERHSRELICLTGGDSGPLNRALIRRDFRQAERLLERLTSIFGISNVAVEIERSYLPWQRSINRHLMELADRFGLTACAGGAVTHSRPEDFPIQDTLVCIDSLCTVEEIIGRKPDRHECQPQIHRVPERALNAERFLRSSEEMRLLFEDCPYLLRNTLTIAERCDDDVLPDRTQLPQIYEDDNHALREITYIGAFRRHGQVSPRLRRRINYELDRIVSLGFSRHFLTAFDLVRWADDQQIQFSGRGSVVDSAVAYCLGFSRIDAFEHRLHFDRFLPVDGSKRPDIDIDFEARRRDDVREYLTRKYGRENVATVAAIGAYCTRGIVREVGKALGLSSETIGFLAKRIHGGVPAHQLESALNERPELRDSSIPKERFQWVFKLAEKMMDIPRNIRSHSSGVVISARPICETVPVMWSGSVPRITGDAQHSVESIESVRIIQWDKRSAKHFFDKFDILCLRGQDVLSGTESRVRINSQDFSVTRIPVDDPETYRAMRSGELIGVPQSASPAMRQAHVRLKTQDLHDASLVQAGIRPGVGGAVKLNQLIARRLGKEDYSFEHPEFERILGHTYGIIVFQEQVDQLLQTFCGFTSGEAEDLRDSIYKRRREDFSQQIQAELMKVIVERGYCVPIAEKVVDYVVGFKGYGFAQGHALAFAEISIRSIYCQQNFPSEYFAALLSAQPAGYYGPCTIVNEARSRGVTILSPDVNASDEEFTVEDVSQDGLVVPGGAIRVALKQIASLSESTRKRIIDAPVAKVEKGPAAGTLRVKQGLHPVTYRNEERNGKLLAVAESHIEPAEDQPKEEGTVRYRSFFDFTAKVKPERDELEQLILCGAFDSLHSNRRALLWSIPRAMDYARQLDPGALPIDLPEPEIPEGIIDLSIEEKMMLERRILSLDVERHLLSYERERISSKGGITSDQARRLEPGRKAIVVGNPIRLRFPPTKSGKRVVFFDLEDETGLLNVTVFDDVYRRDGHAIVCSPYVTIIGEAQDRDGHTAFLAHRVFSYSPRILAHANAAPLPVSGGDFLVG